MPRIAEINITYVYRTMLGQGWAAYMCPAGETACNTINIVFPCPRCIIEQWRKESTRGKEKEK